MAERLTPERLLEMRLCLAGDPDGLLLAEQRYLFAHIDTQQAEIDRLRALLGEAREALIPFARGAGEHYHGEPCRYCRAGAVLAKLAQEGLS